MKIIPVASAHAVQDKSTPEATRTAKAIEAFNRGQSSYDKPVQPVQTAQEHPVQDANNVSAEELGAIKAQVPETTDTNTNTEDTAPTVEETKPPVAPKKDPALDRQFAELSRQERILRAKAQKQQQEFKAREDALKAREDAITARSKEYEQGYISKDRLKADPLQALAEAELSYDDLTQRLLTQQPRDPRVEAHISRLEAKIQQLEQANETSQKTQAQAQQDSYKAALRQIERDATELVKADPTTYEAIAKTKSIKDVVELIEQTYQKDGVLLSVEEAAEEVENYLVEEGVSTLSRIDKIKKRIAQSSTSTVQAKSSNQQTQAKQQTQTGMKTLTNATSSTRKLSARERALLAFKGELKS